MGRPGIMIYFDMLEPIRVLTDAERGRLLTAILEYGKEGKEPAFKGKLALAWGFVRPKIDRDEGSYDMAVLQRKYAGFCSRRSSNGLTKIDFEEWLAMDEQQRKRLLKADCPIPRPSTAVHGCAPTTAATTTATTNTNTYTAISAAADAEPDEEEDASLRRRQRQRERNLKYGMESWERELFI